MVNKKLKIGDIVYCNTTYRTAEKCEITSEVKTLFKTECYLNVKSISGIGSFQCNINNMFLTEEEAIQSYTEKNQKQLEEYKSNINSLEDLIRFAISNMYGEEYTDYEAIQAVKERSKELFDIEID